MLNNELLSILLRFHGDHSMWTRDSDMNETEELRDMGLLTREPDGFYRITKRGFAITSAAIIAANGVR
jgi:hypothetical protein